MLKVFIFMSVLCLIDLILLKIMPRFYFRIGIPIYKSIIDIKQNKTLNDIGVYMGISEEIVYKIRNNTLLFRTRFTYSNLYKGTGFLSIIKGEIKMNDNKAYIVQRINLTTLYSSLFILYILITKEIGFVGYIFLGIILIISILYHLVRITQIEKIRNDAETYLNEEKKLHSRWGD